MSDAQVIVFGEALVDAFADGPVPGGAPFNVACHLAALGLSPRLITRLGEDDAGSTLRAAAARCGLSLDSVQHDEHTARVLVHERDGGHVFEIPPAQAFDRIDAAQAVAAMPAAGAAPSWIYFGTLALRAPASRAALAAVRAAMPHRAFVDLNWREAGPQPAAILELLRDVHVLKLSDAELAMLLHWLALAPMPGLPAIDDEHASMRALCTRTGARHVLVSHGADGAAAWNGEGRCVARAAAPPVPQVMDTVGAGDAFSAMMLAGLALGHPLAYMLGQAVAFASLSCGWRGALPAQMALYRPWQCTLARVADSAA
ncbi:PfkB family carbohydrate kinase [Dyella sp.]|jgi:fructokinase|uniref:PfkB family carbohydrate kinase n=1 Tax=Dyella sp. TaxID=1869338 RepID=UPI002D79D632|nr:PfkB family carbohydrate kinase [Dyella sp.]HET6431679.1 PfkB family carbohydrate kinase [Dyella sp.]